ncbi:PaaX family transcriptional regulator [Thermopolyspora flexuosa]|uniref:PaaX family transcriptional regulator n=1 Tax=Thermopolyspora flexuosa TaxID=103836 RepID=A0A543IY16_9ACTN|nr:PaaX family transcriptional regulator C-terminal domain-containing protein [Thermopolyspora flexuosa]TQM75469.1 PaaX family transcriptional regulator [Thermopolyspora flexuosa]GGM59606.1 PaaX family transcriptional regulator [Thermopolyspora flexuosa]
MSERGSGAPPRDATDQGAHAAANAASAVGAAGAAPAPAPALRPQALMLTFCALYMLDRCHAVYSGSLIEVLGRVGVGEHTARSTLSRMSARGLLERHRSGKRVYFALTDQAVAVLQEGGRRLGRVVNREWDGAWTLLGFSLPESRRADRHLLRSRLAWAGFGPLQSGLWIAPHPVDVTELLAGLDVVDHVKAFRAHTLPPTVIDEMINDAWDLERIGAGYRAFLDRWAAAGTEAGGGDPLSELLLMSAEWLLLIRQDPRLPLRHLPPDWPAVPAERMFLARRATLMERARPVVDALLDRLPLDH